MMAPNAGPLVEDRTKTVSAVTAPITGNPGVAEDLLPQTNIAPASTILHRLSWFRLGSPSGPRQIKRVDEQTSKEPNDPGPDHSDPARLAHGRVPLLLAVP